MLTALQRRSSLLTWYVYRRVICPGPLSDAESQSRVKTCSKKPSKSVSIRRSDVHAYADDLTLVTAQEAMEKLTIEKVRWRAVYTSQAKY